MKAIQLSLFEDDMRSVSDEELISELTNGNGEGVRGAHSVCSQARKRNGTRKKVGCSFFVPSTTKGRAMLCFSKSTLRRCCCQVRDRRSSCRTKAYQKHP